MRRRSPIAILIAVIMAIVGAVSYYSSKSVNQVTNEVQYVRLTPEQEIALGLEAAPEMARQFGGVVRDRQLAGYVESVGRRVVERSQAARADYRFEFHVLADPKTVNAFALPGGQVFVTVGLLRGLTSEAELAGVLGHEIGHVVGRHGAEHLAKAEFAQTLVGAVGVASYDPENPNAGAGSAAIAAAIAQLVNLKYGRDDELESDALGVRFMREAGYHPRGMVELMHVLARAGGGRRGGPEFFSTHPNPENRIARLDELARADGADGGETGEDRYAANVLRVLGPSP